MRSEFEHNNALALERLIETTDVKLRRFSDPVLKRMAEISEQVLAEVAASDAFTAEVYESFKTARRRGGRWGEISEQAFAAARAFSTNK